MARRLAANRAMATEARDRDRGDRRSILLARPRQSLGWIPDPRDRSRRNLAGRAGSTFVQGRMMGAPKPRTVFRRMPLAVVLRCLGSRCHLPNPPRLVGFHMGVGDAQ